jgi:hypothetical protein
MENAIVVSDDNHRAIGMHRRVGEQFHD